MSSYDRGGVLRLLEIEHVTHLVLLVEEEVVVQIIALNEVILRKVEFRILPGVIPGERELELEVFTRELVEWCRFRKVPYVVEVRTGFQDERLLVPRLEALLVDIERAFLSCEVDLAQHATHRGNRGI